MVKYGRTEDLGLFRTYAKAPYARYGTVTPDTVADRADLGLCGHTGFDRAHEQMKENSKLSSNSNEMISALLTVVLLPRPRLAEPSISLPPFDRC